MIEHIIPVMNTEYRAVEVVVGNGRCRRGKWTSCEFQTARNIRQDT